MEQQVFLCPLCNAPHDEKLQPGTLQVKCKYCGGLIIVPSRLSELYQQCPDHPEFQSVALCTKCGRNCCDICLRVLERFGAPTRYLCAKCMKEVLWTEAFYRRLWVVCYLFFMPVLMLGVGRPASGPSGVFVFILGSSLVVAPILAMVLYDRLKEHRIVPTLREKRQDLKSRFGDV